MEVITLLNEKGGCGKTTLATHIAAGLAIRGLRVVLVDTDPQGHATIAFGLSKAPGLYNLLVRDAEWRNVLVTVPPENYTDHPIDGWLMVVPSNGETAAIPQQIPDTYLFSERIAELEGFADVIVIDTPPTLSMLHGSAYTATDYMLYPTKSAFLSFDGLVSAMGRLDGENRRRLKSGDPEIINMGIVPTMHRANTVEHSENLRHLQERFGALVWEPIADAIVWEEASALMQPIWMVNPNSKSVLEVTGLIERIARGVNVQA